MIQNNAKIYGDLKSILVTREEIAAAVQQLGEKITRDYQGRNLLMVGILKGSVVFMGDLMKKVTLPVEIDFMKVSSYKDGTVSSGRINILLDLHRKDLSECNIVIVEDIIDSGRTLSYLVNYLKLGGARSVKTCTLLDKPCRRDPECKNFTPDYVGREIPDEFVVGYGLDYAEQYRALPFVGILKPEVYEKG